MTTPLDLPALDKLHAEAHPGTWSYDPTARETEGSPSFKDDQGRPVICGGPFLNMKHGELIVALVNAFPALSARLKLLEQTLRGVIEEKSDKRLEYFNNGDDDDWEEINNQIAWLERALGGEL